MTVPISTVSARCVLRHTTRSSIATHLRTGTACLPRALHSGTYRTPKPFNEPNLHYAPGSPERQKLIDAVHDLKQKLPLYVPSVGGKQVQFNESSLRSDVSIVALPFEHKTPFAAFQGASEADVNSAIQKALKAKEAWANTPFTDRAAIFLRAAELVSGKYRYELMAATMLGQGKNAWQAEIDAAAELADFFRYNVSFAQEIYDQQPKVNSPNHHGRTDWRPLEGFVYSVSPFNFTAIGGNLISAPAIMGNVVLWKPAEMTVYSSHLVHQILLEAGLPPDVVQLVNGDPVSITSAALSHPKMSALNFIGSSAVFRSLWGKIAKNASEGKYRDFPRMVGETSGKNFHLVHSSADIENAVKHTIRASFEYAGQKCSACSRIYIPQSQAAAFFAKMKDELKAVKTSHPEDFSAFTGPVIDKKAFDRISTAIDKANADQSLTTVVGGTYNGEQGYYIDPTIYVAKDPTHELFNEELFGPVLVAYVYPDAEFEQVLTQIDQNGGNFALTGSIFSNDRAAARLAENKLRYAAGNFYVNCKITAAVIGQQTFGGARGSGTCDKAGSVGLLTRFVAPRTLKEEYNSMGDVLYPSNATN